MVLRLSLTIQLGSCQRLVLFSIDLQAMSMLCHGSRLMLQAYMHGPTNSACKVSGMSFESGQVSNGNSSQKEGRAAVKCSTGFFQPGKM